MKPILLESILSTSRFPRWWILAILQAGAFSAVGQLVRPQSLNHISAMWLVLVMAVLPPLTIRLWQDIEAYKFINNPDKPRHNFKSQSVSGIGLILMTVFVVLLARWIFPFWPLHTLVFAVTASTAGLSLLYIALCDQNLSSALSLAMDTWNKRISFAGAAAAILIVAHGISYALVHRVLGDLYLIREFSVSGHSATIWLLLAAVVVLIAYLSAILNCFVVLLFLDTINRKKDPETVRQELPALIVSPAGNKI